MISFGTDLVNQSFVPNIEEDSNDLIEKAEQSLYDLSTHGTVETGPRAFENIILEAVNYAEKAFKNDRILLNEP